MKMLLSHDCCSFNYLTITTHEPETSRRFRRAAQDPPVTISWSRPIIAGPLAILKAISCPMGARQVPAAASRYHWGRRAVRARVGAASSDPCGEDHGPATLVIRYEGPKAAQQARDRSPTSRLSGAGSTISGLSRTCRFSCAHRAGVLHVRTRRRRSAVDLAGARGRCDHDRCG